MSQPNFILDGAPPYGTFVLTINAVNYNVNDMTCKAPWKFVENTTTTSLPNQGIWVKQRYEMDGDIQLATGSTAYPPAGATFTFTPPNEATALTFVVVPDDQYSVKAELAIRTSKFKAVQAMNAVTTG